MWWCLIVDLLVFICQALGFSHGFNEFLGGYSLRNWALNDPINPFCYGDTGSIYAVLTPVFPHQLIRACAVNSGPLSHRINVGWIPVSAMMFSGTATTSGAVNDRRGMIAKDLRVDSSMALKNLICRPSVVASDWKSKLITCIGY